MSIYLLPLLTIPLLTHVLPSSQGTPTNNLQVNLAINYGNGTAVWYNGTSVPTDSNFFNVTTLVTNNDTGAIFFASFGSHFVYSINGVGCPVTNPFCDVAWSFWTLDGICWDPAQVGVDQVERQHDRAAAPYRRQLGTPLLRLPHQFDEGQRDVVVRKSPSAVRSR